MGHPRRKGKSADLEIGDPRSEERFIELTPLDAKPYLDYAWSRKDIRDAKSANDTFDDRSGIKMIGGRWAKAGSMWR